MKRSVLARLNQTSPVMFGWVLATILVHPALGQSGCCLVLPTAPDNSVTVNLKDRTVGSPGLIIVTVLNRDAPVPPQDYPAWCMDWETIIDISSGGIAYNGQIYSSCDPNLNTYLPDHTNTQGQIVDKVDAATWKKINYLLNHRAGYNYFDVQVAMLNFVGGPYVVFAGDPPTNAVAVAELIRAAEANAADWQPQCGDSMAGILNFEPNFNPLEADVQLLIIEVPCHGSSLPVFSGLPATTALYQCMADVPPPPLVTAANDCNVVLNVGFNETQRQPGSACNNTIVRTWTATNTGGNTTNFTQTITVSDTIPPVITCLPNRTIECGIAWDFDPPSATDLCGANVTISIVATETNELHATLFSATRTWMAADACGNFATCAQTVSVVDAVAPEILCPQDIAVIEDPPGSGVAAVTYAPRVTDNCDLNPIVVCLPPSGSTFPVGEHTVVCSASDAGGNTNGCSFTIKVVLQTILVNSTDDSGPGTLRQALLDANGAPGTNVIVFNVPGPALYLIQLLSPLPAITDPVILDGSSQSNFSGTPLIEVDGTGTGADGLVLSADGTIVRGLVLNGFTIGIRVESANNVIQGNVIGTDLTGTIMLFTVGQTQPRSLISRDLSEGLVQGNTGDGISINSPGNLIGGDFPNAGNIISGNGGNGIYFETAQASNNVVQGNVIALNGVNGVLLDASAGAGNAIRANSIASNGALGIDLGGDGATTNHPGDAGAGPNNHQNYPLLLAARSLDGVTTIDGVINAATKTIYQIEFFLNSAPNPSGFGEGQTFLGTNVLKTDRNGNRNFTVSFPIANTAEQFITATATDPANNTSEFGPAQQIIGPPALVVEPIGTNVALGAEITLCASASGSEPLFYQWRQNGQNIPDATNACYTIPSSAVADGGDYTVAVANDLGAVISEPASLLLQLPTTPVGDNFENRVTLTRTNGMVAGTNSFATREPGEPNPAGEPGGSSIWYTWTAPDTGIATFRTTGSTFDTLMGIYTGSVVSNLTTVASDDDAGGFFSSLASFNAVAGTAYQIAIDGFGGATGTVVLSWNLEVTAETVPVITAQPANQTVAAGSSASFTVLATGTAPLAYQWFLNGSLISGATDSTFTVTNVQPDTLGNYTVQVSAGTEVVESQAASLQINDTDAGVEAVEAMDKLLDAENSPNPLQLGNPPAGLSAPKPRFAGAGIVRGYTGTQVFSTVGSTTQLGEEPICNVIGGASQWICFVPGESGFLFLNTDGSTYDTVMAVFTRPPTTGPLVQIACDNNSGINGKTSSLIVPVEAGKTNFIVVDGVGGATGLLHLNYSLATLITLTSIGITPQGAYHVQFSGRAAQQFVIERSPDLIQWSPLATTNAPGGLLDFLDASSPAALKRYYRALLLP